MAGKTPRKNSALKLATAAARIAQDDNAEDIVVLDLRGISEVTDYFVICTGTSARQMATVADDITDHGKSIGQRVYRVTGLETGQWILADFVDVVVHIFDKPQRSYYDLELMWGDSPRVDWRKPGRQKDAGEVKP